MNPPLLEEYFVVVLGLSPILNMANFQYSTLLTLAGSELMEDSWAIPAPCAVTDSRFATVANGGRINNTILGGASELVTMPADFDIRSTVFDEATSIPFEFEYYDAATGEMVFHFMVDELIEDEDQTFYLCYGNPAVTTSQEQITALWSDYYAVYHFAEPSGNTFYNSASDNNHLDYTTISATGRTGKLGYGVEFDGVDDYLQIGTLAGGANTEFAVNYLFNTTHRLPGLAYITPIAGTGGAGEWSCRLYTGLGAPPTGTDSARAYFLYDVFDGGVCRSMGYPEPGIYSGNWVGHHSNRYWTGSYYSGFGDTSLNELTVHSSGCIASGSDLSSSNLIDVIIGRSSYSSNTDNFKGFLDEVRIRDNTDPFDNAYDNFFQFVFNPDIWEIDAEATVTGRVYCRDVKFESGA